MNEVKCPNCGMEFSLEETAYEKIVEHVHNKEFEHIIGSYKEVLKSEKDKEFEISIRDAKEEYEKNEIYYKQQIAELQNELELYKNFKMRLSTKMVGQSLEDHCEAEFNQIRSMFPNATFIKDNDSSQGSKGDFIYREEKDGIEFISIMFEMKNEADGNGPKTKNAYHFPKLDEDRTKKNCEYAVLVSLLEKNNEFYNLGIVEAPCEYKKMYVIRPQCFLTIISLLRNAALNTFEYKQKLIEIQKQQLDIYQFEDNLFQFKNDFLTSFNLANDRYNDAIEGINSTISALEDIRDNLETSKKHLNSANNKIQKISIKKLAKDAPSVLEMFENKEG